MLVGNLSLYLNKKPSPPFFPKDQFKSEVLRMDKM